MQYTFRVGQRVMWSGIFGTAPARLATVEALSSKNGRPVYCLDNNHWAYENQLRKRKMHPVEEMIIRAMCQRLINAGWVPWRVEYYPQDGEGAPATTIEEVMTEVCSVDESVILFKKGDARGSVLVVLGNREDVLSDGAGPEEFHDLVWEVET